MDSHSFSKGDSDPDNNSPLRAKRINTPFGYFGSKNKIAFRLANELPPHNCWVEAFCGSAALTLSKTPASIEVLNDIYGDIVNLFKQLRDNQDELCRLISLTPYAREELLNSRHFSTSDTEIERARKFLVQAMFSINGVFGKDKSGFSYSQSYSRNGKDARVNRWYMLPERVEKVVERIRNVRIENRDGADLLKMFVNRPATLVYLDPPYLGKRVEGYNNEANDEDYHYKLLELANNSKCMIFISGYENDLYNEMLTQENGWEKRIIGTQTKDNRGKSFKRDEVVWMNSQYQKAKSLGEVPIDLTTKEIKENKINPER